MGKTIHFGYWQWFGVSERYGFVSLGETEYSPREAYYSREWVKRYRKYMQDDSYDIQVQ